MSPESLDPPAALLMNTPPGGVNLSNKKLFDRRNTQLYPPHTPGRTHLGRHALQRIAPETPIDYGYDALNKLSESKLRDFRASIRARIHLEAETAPFRAAYELAADTTEQDPLTALKTELAAFDTQKAERIHLLQQARHDVSSIYGEAAEVLDTLTYQYQLDQPSGTFSPETAKLVGNISEYTIFALAARTMRGDLDDPYHFLPATPSEDQGGRDTNGTRYGFDFRVHRTSDGGVAHIQVKTLESDAARAKYHPNILVVSMESVAGSIADTYRLQSAIVKELQNTPHDPDECALIDASQVRLFGAIDAHIDRAGMPQ